MRVRGKDDLGRRKIISEEVQVIPAEFRMQASDVKESVRKYVLDLVNIKTHTDLALECIELTRSRLGIHGPVVYKNLTTSLRIFQFPWNSSEILTDKSAVALSHENELKYFHPYL